MRGEKSCALVTSGAGVGSPPLARGKVGTDRICHGGKRITPACAGKSYRQAKGPSPIKDHPRLRGEKIPSFRMRPCVGGSPPLARGKVDFVEPFILFQRITPACAGKSVCWRTGGISDEDHPRLRGEKNRLEGVVLLFQGSPPLARGKVQNTFNFSFNLRITPACAGKSVQHDCYFP